MGYKLFLELIFTDGANGTSFLSKDELSSLNESVSKRSLLPQPSAFGSKRPRFNITSFGPVVLVSTFYKDRLATFYLILDRIVLTQNQICLC